MNPQLQLRGLREGIIGPRPDNSLKHPRKCWLVNLTHAGLKYPWSHRGPVPQFKGYYIVVFSVLRRLVWCHALSRNPTGGKNRTAKVPPHVDSALLS